MLQTLIPPMGRHFSNAGGASASRLLCRGAAHGVAACAGVTLTIAGNNILNIANRGVSLATVRRCCPILSCAVCSRCAALTRVHVVSLCAARQQHAPAELQLPRWLPVSRRHAAHCCECQPDDPAAHQVSGQLRAFIVQRLSHSHVTGAVASTATPMPRCQKFAFSTPRRYSACCLR